MEKIPTTMLVVAAALRDAEGRWLMHKRPAHKHHGGLWEFPGGKVEADEIPIVALVRELQEELGIEVDAKDLRPLGFASEGTVDSANQIVILLYTARHWHGEVRALEGGEVRWFEFARLDRLECPPLDIALIRQIAEKEAA